MHELPNLHASLFPASIPLSDRIFKERRHRIIAGKTEFRRNRAASLRNRGYTVAAMMPGSDSTGKSTAAYPSALRIASLFELPTPIEVSDFPNKGNINRQTFLVVAGSPHNSKEYVLQQLNPEVFAQPRTVMDSMIACIRAQEDALRKGVLRTGEEWEPVRLVPTKEGKAYLELSDGEGPKCWRMMNRISNTRTYKRLSEIADASERLRVAEEAGRGLALFHTLTVGLDSAACRSPLPGYRDTSLYYDQLKSILAGNRTPAQAASYLPPDPVVRRSTERFFVIHLTPEEYLLRREDPELRRFIHLALEQEFFALTLSRGLETGTLKEAVIHGDTKLDNFLFSTETGKVRSLVDLDTVMTHTWLSDWGDMVRSLSNISGERERLLDRIDLDLEIFKASARGYAGTARHISPHEVDLMVEAGRIMALELGVRFLADYLRGDNYFKLESTESQNLNKTRALVQFSVFESLSRKAALLKQYILELFRSNAPCTGEA